MNDHAGTLEEVRAAIFKSKEEQRRRDAEASPEEKFLMLEVLKCDQLIFAMTQNDLHHGEICTDSASSYCVNPLISI